MRKPIKSELAFVKERVRSSQGLALALSTTAGILHEGMQQTETLLDDYDKQLALRAELLNQLQSQLLRLADRADDSREPRRGIVGEINTIRAWLADHWKEGTLVKSEISPL